MKELTTTYSHEKSYYFLSLSLEKTVLTSLKRLLFEKKKMDKPSSKRSKKHHSISKSLKLTESYKAFGL